MGNRAKNGVWVHWLALWCCQLCPAPCTAESETLRALTRYVHTRWSLADGFTHFPVQALAQTHDGYLWIGTPSGLWRFDGVRFQRWLASEGDRSLASEDVRALCPSRDGGLWIATNGGLRRMRQGSLQPHYVENSAGLRAVRGMVEDAGGALWAGVNGYGRRGLAKIDGERIQWLDTEGTRSGVNALATDAAGKVWVGSSLGLCPAGAARQHCIGSGSPHDVYSVSNNARGLLAVTAQGAAVATAAGLNPLPKLPDDARARIVLGDRKDNIWVGALSQGLFLLNADGWEQFTNRDGLSGATVQALLEDREGNIWVGTRTGLDRFRPNVVERYFTSSGLSDNLVTAVLPSSLGQVWVATPSNGLYRVDEKMAISKPEIRGIGGAITALMELPGGALLAGTSRGLFLTRNAMASEISGASGERLDRVTVITSDRNGVLWLSDARRGLYTLRGNVAVHFTHESLPRQMDVYALAVDSENALWVGFYHGEVARIRGSSLELFDSRHGLAPGPVLSIFCDSKGAVYVGGGSGLSRYYRGGWSAWTTSSGLPAAPVHDIMEDSFGDLWLSSPEGAVRVELSAGASGQVRPRLATVYGRSAGMPPQTQTLWAKPRIAKSADGRLWFATEDGIAVINPARRKSPLPAPAVMIEDAFVDNERRDAQVPPGQFQFRGRELRVNYTATGMSAPETIRFRYRLTPFEASWVDADTRRQATYANLAPGDYRFQVAASDAEGEWPDASTELNFTVLPMFYQTTAFKLSAGLLVFAGCFVLYRWRLAQLARKLEGIAEGRLAERSRIARDLHDTLLQSVVGVSLQIDAFANRFPPQLETEREELRRIRRQFDTALRDARHSVWALRIPATHGRPLADCLQETVAMLDYRGNFTVTTHTEGEPYEVELETEEQILRIAHAAIANAVLHSEGTRITLETIYGKESLIVRICDDGQGMEPRIVENGKPGHYGLRGMRERAALVGGSVRIISGPSSGTVVQLSIPRKPFFSRFFSAVGFPVERRVKP